MMSMHTKPIQKQVLIIGSGIAGLTCAIETAKAGHKAILAAPFPSERAQSVMAAGGINAALDTCGEQDSVALHVADTLDGGCNIASRKAVERMCSDAPDIIAWLEQLGMVFTRDKNGRIDLRAFGGQCKRRTAYAGAATGKQIVSALVQEARKYECLGQIERRLGLQFYAGLIHEVQGKKQCCGALFYHDIFDTLEPIYADSIVVATGGQNGLFGKTTGSMLCDGYAAGKLFLQGAELKNPEFIQYHPTTIETTQKMITITEGARGDGGRLYYLEDGRRVYFMEEQYGAGGNLMSRDIVSKCIADIPSQVYLDISFLGKAHIEKHLPEVQTLCRDYIGIDVSRESIPVTPSVHFFMGGLAVDSQHRTNIAGLYAIGECAAQYHGANRLGGNSLLAAIHSGRIAAADIAQSAPHSGMLTPDALQEIYKDYIAQETAKLYTRPDETVRVSPTGVRGALAKIMREDLGISRNRQDLESGMQKLALLWKSLPMVASEPGDTRYQGYKVEGMLALAEAVLSAALARKESRGAHIRADYPTRNDMEYQASTVVRWNDGRCEIRYEKEDL